MLLLLCQHRCVLKAVTESVLTVVLHNRVLGTPISVNKEYYPAFGDLQPHHKGCPSPHIEGLSCNNQRGNTCAAAVVPVQVGLDFLTEVFLAVVLPGRDLYFAQQQGCLFLCCSGRS